MGDQLKAKGRPAEEERPRLTERTGRALSEDCYISRTSLLRPSRIWRTTEALSIEGYRERLSTHEGVTCAGPRRLRPDANQLFVVPPGQSIMAVLRVEDIG